MPKQESPSPNGDNNEATNPRDALYNKCAQKPEGTIFYQDDLAKMQVTKNMDELAALLQELCKHHLMKLMMSDGAPCWKLRSQSDAKSIGGLSNDERLLYHFIDQAQSEGIWSKELRAKTNVTQQSLTKSLKNLETNGLVKSVMSVKFPSRKMYLLKHLQPSPDVVGGRWQKDGDWDTALMNTVADVVAKYIEEQTCILVPSNWNPYYQQERDRVAAIEGKRAEVRTVTDIEEAPLIQPFTFMTDPRAPSLLHRDEPRYPTATSIAEWLNNTEILTDKGVTGNDLGEILEMMELDGRVQQMRGGGYRTDLGTLRTRASNGFVDSPCGICPVFNRCGETGEITARTCKYFAEWLETESEEV